MESTDLKPFDNLNLKYGFTETSRALSVRLRLDSKKHQRRLWVHQEFEAALQNSSKKVRPKNQSGID